MYFYACCIKKWRNLGDELREVKSTVQLKMKVLNSVMKLFNRLALHFSYLNEYKFWHNFRATIDPMCNDHGATGVLNQKQHSVTPFFIFKISLLNYTHYITIYTEVLTSHFVKTVALCNN